MNPLFFRMAVLSLFLALWSAAEAVAIPVGAPVRTLEVGGFSLSGSIGYTDMEIRDEDVVSKSFFFKGAYGGGGIVSPYLKLGFADLDAGGFKGSLDFAYGGGVLLDIVSKGSEDGFRLSLDSQALWIKSTEGGVTFDLFEGQLSVLGSVRNGGTNSFAGISSSFIDLDGGGQSERENGMSHLFFGVDYFMDYNFYFSAEAHLFGQDSLSVGVGYLF